MRPNLDDPSQGWPCQAPLKERRRGLQSEEVSSRPGPGLVAAPRPRAGQPLPSSLRSAADGSLQYFFNKIIFIFKFKLI